MYKCYENNIRGADDGGRDRKRVNACSRAMQDDSFGFTLYIYIYSREWHGAHDPPIQRIDKVCAVKSHHPRKSSEITFFPLFLPRPPPSQRVYAPTIHIILYRVFRLGVRVDPSYTLRRVRLENINNNNIWDPVERNPRPRPRRHTFI